MGDEGLNLKRRLKKTLGLSSTLEKFFRISLLPQSADTMQVFKCIFSEMQYLEAS